MGAGSQPRRLTLESVSADRVRAKARVDGAGGLPAESQFPQVLVKIKQMMLVDSPRFVLIRTSVLPYQLLHAADSAF